MQRNGSLGSIALNVGGFAGYNQDSSITTSYSTSEVYTDLNTQFGRTYVGGFIGNLDITNSDIGSIQNNFAFGNITSTSNRDGNTRLNYFGTGLHIDDNNYSTSNQIVIINESVQIPEYWTSGIMILDYSDFPDFSFYEDMLGFSTEYWKLFEDSFPRIK